MTRIVAGRFGGRRLAVPAGRDTRPTSDRVREALFSAIEARVDLTGARFADLYAGSGAVGIEALSRGASEVLLVESDPRAARTIRDNIATIGAGTATGAARGAAARLVVDRVERLLARPPAVPHGPYDVVFADPPYALPDAEVTSLLTALAGNAWLAVDALVVIERSSRDAPVTWVPGITGEGGKRYGETALWYGRRS